MKLIHKQTNVSCKRPSLRNSSVLDLLQLQPLHELKMRKTQQKELIEKLFVPQLFLFAHPKTSERTSYQSSQFNYSEVIVFLQLEASSRRKVNKFSRGWEGEALDTSDPSFSVFSLLSSVGVRLDSRILL